MQFLLGQFIQLHLFRLIKILLWPLCIRPEENSELTFSALLYCHRRRPRRQRRRRHHRRRRKRRRRRRRRHRHRRCYLHILNASTSATIGTVRSSVRLQEHHHPFKHDVKFLSFDSDDSGLARSAYFMEHGGLDTTALLLTVDSTHSGYLDPKKILSTIDPPPGVPGVSKNHIFFTNESVFLLR